MTKRKNRLVGQIKALTREQLEEFLDWLTEVEGYSLWDADAERDATELERAGLAKKFLVER